MQVNIDFESEQDMVEKARIGLALQPVATALFANSPFRDGKPTGQQAALSSIAFSLYDWGRTQFISHVMHALSLQACKHSFLLPKTSFAFEIKQHKKFKRCYEKKGL